MLTNVTEMDREKMRCYNTGWEAVRRKGVCELSRQSAACIRHVRPLAARLAASATLCMLLMCSVSTLLGIINAGINLAENASVSRSVKTMHTHIRKRKQLAFIFNVLHKHFNTQRYFLGIYRYPHECSISKY